MQIKIYDVDQSEAETFRAECALRECFPDDAEGCNLARGYLAASGRYRLGGGAAPIVLLVRAELRPDDIILPNGWTWARVDAERAKWEIADDMIPIAAVAGAAVAWGTINSYRIERTQRIAELNDQFRRHGIGGRVMMTAGVAARNDAARESVVEAMRWFDSFDADNDPHGEHDCASFDVDGTSYMFKIDYYDSASDYTMGSDDPSDTQKTSRVLTLMLASES